MCVEIMSEKISEEEFQKQYEFSESSKKIAYSGRAKSQIAIFIAILVITK